MSLSTEEAKNLAWNIVSFFALGVVLGTIFGMYLMERIEKAARRSVRRGKEGGSDE